MNSKRTWSGRGDAEPGYPCPCCAWAGFGASSPGTHEICSACGWEDDPLQFDDPNFRGGANELSLMEAREYFERHGSSCPRPSHSTRRPLP